MRCHCDTNNRPPRWTFTDPWKPEVRLGARDESASPAWLGAPAMNARDTTLREKSSFHTKETYRKPAGNPGFTRGFPLVSIPATPSFPVVSILWKALTAQIPEWKPRGNHWKPGVSNRKPRGNHWKPGVTRQETPWKPLETWGCQTGNYTETTGNLGLPERKLPGNLE